MRNYLVMNHRVGKKIGNRSCICEAHSHTNQKPILGESKVIQKLKFGENMALASKTNGNQLCIR